MNSVSLPPALSEEYSDIIVRQSPCQNAQSCPSALLPYSSQLPLPADLPAQPVSGQFTILYAPLSDHLATVEEIGYTSVPKLFTEINVVSLEKSGILPVRIHSFSEWSGKGVLMGFLDTGIDYTHPAFRNMDGTTRILRLWDQADTSGLPPVGISYGTEYTDKDINRALFQNSSATAENDKSLLQTVSPDPLGHGTAVAGIACGSADASEGFTGVAPESSIAFVKLKQAKQYLRDYFRIPENSIACQEDDLMLGIRYLSDCASALDMPLVICMSLGSSQGGHTGHTPLEDLINEMLYERMVSAVIDNAPWKERTAHAMPCICTITGTGNETSLAHHYFGRIQSVDGTGNTDAGPITSVNVELLVEQETDGFTLEFWPDAPGLYTLGFTSPIGETISPIRPETGISREFSFLLEKSRIGLIWSSSEGTTEPGGSQVALIRFTDPTPGIWTIRADCLKHGSRSPVSTGSNSKAAVPTAPAPGVPAHTIPDPEAQILSTSDFGAAAQKSPDSEASDFGTAAQATFHLWLPISGLIDPYIRFLVPDANTTLVIPSCASSAITVGTWNAYEGSLYPHSGRGYTRKGHIKPDLASPGVRVTSPGASGSYVSLTGSCAAGAITAGAAALLLSAGLRQNPPRYFSSEEVKQFLLLGVQQRNYENYPNQAWGYGTMNLQNSLNQILAQNL